MGALDFLKRGNNRENDTDPFELLKKDHRTVEQLFSQLEEDTGQRDELFKQLKSELELHTRIEETIFYPALKREEETRDIILEAFEEHKGVKTLLQEMEQTPSNDARWDAKLKVLKENVEHHVEEEEGEMFEKARDVLSEDEQQKLGRRMFELKQKAAPGSETARPRATSTRTKGQGRSKQSSRRTSSTRKKISGTGRSRSAAASQPARKRRPGQKSSKRVVAKKKTSRRK